MSIWTEITNLSVVAECDPQCLNGGICIRPNVCHCQNNWEGSHCQIERSKPCLNPPPIPRNSRLSCSDK